MGSQEARHQRVVYQLRSALLATTHVTVTKDRFTSVGFMQEASFPLDALVGWCLEPAANVGRFDAHLVVAWNAGRRRRSRRIKVRVEDPSLIALLGTLRALRPDAALHKVPLEEALRRMGVTSTKTLAWRVALGIVCGIAILATALVLASRR